MLWIEIRQNYPDPDTQHCFLHQVVLDIERLIELPVRPHLVQLSLFSKENENCKFPEFFALFYFGYLAGNPKDASLSYSMFVIGKPSDNYWPICSGKFCTKP
jgi:hypothetical protein